MGLISLVYQPAYLSIWPATPSFQRGLSTNDLRKGDLLGKGAMSEAVKSLPRAANVWWRCAQYFAIASRG